VRSGSIGLLGATSLVGERLILLLRGGGALRWFVCACCQGIDIGLLPWQNG